MIKILMVEDDEMVCDSFEIAIKNNAEFSLVNKTGKQNEAMNILQTMEVDVMLLDLELEEGDGIHLLEEMKQTMESLPEIITVTNTCSESILSCVRELGSDFVYRKKNGAYSPENILEIIQMTFPYYKGKMANRTQVLAAQYSMEKEAEYQLAYVRRELEKMGFLPQKKGTFFLAEAICFMLNQKVRSKVQITNDVYPAIAKKYGASIGGIEKAIRDAIDRVWKKTDIATLTAFYPHQWDDEMGRPTNAEFITNMVDKFRNLQ